MRIQVKVKPRSKTEDVTREIGGDVYVVRVKQPPVEGKANRAVLRLLARHFGVPESHLRIVSGLSSKNKVIEVIPSQGAER
ncbi:MAG: DUF167 domain-containing protein [Dehalococcoidia bacterium]|nr:DUF167 domain-containing protein [Dehalococcoidia bacterium]